VEGAAMTRPFNETVCCPYCGCTHTYEPAFGRWLRENEKLSSGKGYAVCDVDYIIHKYKTSGYREFQCIMWVEIKTNGSKLKLSQQDTLEIVNQMLRNRKETPTKKCKYQAGSSIITVFSRFLRRKVTLKSFGVHVLTFSAWGPNDSKTMLWDGKEINESILTQLCAFNLDPDTLKPLDLRSHHRTHHNQNGDLFLSSVP
jgi:hypothetical protein